VRRLKRKRYGGKEVGKRRFPFEAGKVELTPTKIGIVDRKSRKCWIGMKNRVGRDKRVFYSAIGSKCKV
jgi:hypothetical protein